MTHGNTHLIYVLPMLPSRQISSFRRTLYRWWRRCWALCPNKGKFCCTLPHSHWVCKSSW